MSDSARGAGRRDARRILLYSHDTLGLGHLRRTRTIATALVEADPSRSALILTGSPIAGRFDFPSQVDHVRLPGIVKLADGSYRPSKLRLELEEMVALRGAIIAAAEREFAPDLVIVDKEPWGFRQEMAGALGTARARGARIVLGVRDVLDDDAALVEEWTQKQATEAVEAFYDEIWIYGVPEICRPLDALDLSAEARRRIIYTGYLPRDTGPLPPEAEAELPGHPYVLVTPGGGQDGEALVDWVLSAYEADRALEPPALIVYGPFMAAAARHEFDRRAAVLGGRVITTDFHARLERLLAAAEGVVAMGGYNTFCEILSADRPAVVVPRTRPRAEQLIRARAAERLGLLRMLLPGPEGRDGMTMARAIRGLAHQPRPSAARMPHLLGGIETIVGRVGPAKPLALAGG